MNNKPVAWTACLDCGKRVTGDSIHTCSPQIKELTDDEILDTFDPNFDADIEDKELIKFARAILRKASK
jgi:hypothetical protein